jgi:hypothetical protein
MKKTYHIHFQNMQLRQLEFWKSEVLNNIKMFV